MISTASAEILISQPDSRYNLGDNFNVKIEVKRVVETNDFLIVRIVCDSNSVELYKGPLMVGAGKTENLTIKAQLDRSLIKSTEGSCRVEADYADESVQSASFEITDKIDLVVTLSSNNFNPGDLVYISGTAKKKNGEKIDGFLHISLSGTNVSFLANQLSNSFNYSFNIPQDQPANLYSLNIKVYEREPSGEIANEGLYSEVIKVNQVIRSGDVSINSPSIEPGQNLSYSIILRDQTSAEVKMDVNSMVYTSSGSIFAKSTKKSGDLIYLELPKQASPGRWEIEGIYGSLPLNRSFTVVPLSKASFAVDGNELVITNEGNVDYEETFVVFIGDQEERPKVSIPVGSSKRFTINAPAGEYEINVNDAQGKGYDLGPLKISESESNSVFTSLITGKAIQLNDSSISSTSYIRIIFWLVIIIALLYATVYYYKKVKKDVFYGKKPQKLSDTKLAFKTSQARSNQEPVKSSYANRSRDAEQKPVQMADRSKLMFDTYDHSSVAKNNENYEAKREEVVVLALKIKNGSKLRQSESTALNAVRNALHKARTAKGKVYDQGDTSLVVFSQSLSDKATALEAVRVAHQINMDLREFNRKYAIKIEYGLGMHIGEMFFEIIDGKAKFTSIGNITILSKNLASRADFALLLSSELYRKVYTIIKAEQVDGGYYNVVSFKDRTNQSQFIKRFMKKSEDEVETEVKPAVHHRVPHSNAVHHAAKKPAPFHSSARLGNHVRTVAPSKPIDSGLHPPKKRAFQRY